MSTPAITPPPAFDVQGARKAGYSDDEILQHLTESRNFDVQGALNSGYSKQEIIDHLSGAPSVTPTPTSHPPGYVEELGNVMGAPNTPQKAGNLLTTGGTKNSPFDIPEKTFWDKVVNLGPLNFNPGQAVKNVAATVGGGVTSGVDSFKQNTHEAIQNIKDGGPILSNVAKILSGYTDMIKGVNPVVNAGGVAGTDIGERNYRGAAGAITGGLLQAPLLKGGLDEAGLNQNAAGDLVVDKPPVPGVKPGLARNVLGTVKAVPKAITETVRDANDALAGPETLTPEEAFTKATRPRNSIVAAKQRFAQALPDARAALDELGIKPENMTLEDAESAITKGKVNVWREFHDRFLGPNKDTPINTDTVADSIETKANKLSPITKRQLGDKWGTDLDASVADYRGKQMSIADIEQRIQDLNNELRGKQGQFKVKEMDMRNDPQYSGKFAELDALRQVEADAFDKLSGPGAAALKQRYGALKTMQDVIDRRINVADRSAPVGGMQTLTRARGLGKVVKGMVTADPGDILEGLVNFKMGENARLYNDPDFLIQQAFGKTTPRAPFMPQRFSPVVRPAPVLPPQP